MAETIGVDDQVSLLEEILEEEKHTDEKLTELAEQINTQANDSGNEQQDDEEIARQKEVQASSVMCHTEGVFGSFGARRFRSSRLIFLYFSTPTLLNLPLR